MHSAYTQTHMSYLIMELSPHIPLLAVTTLALVFVVNPIWFSVLLLLITFFDFFGLCAFASSVTSVDPIMLDLMNRARCSRSQARKKRQDRIAEALRQETQLGILGTLQLVLYSTKMESYGSYENMSEYVSQMGTVQNTVECNRTMGKVHDSI